MSTTHDDTGPREIRALTQLAPCVRFDAVALHDGGEAGDPRGLSFAVSPGSFHVLTGASGSDKTTLLRTISLVEAPARGLVQIFGRDVSALRRDERLALRRRIGSALQPPMFLDHLGVWENAALAPRIAGRKLADYQAQVDELLVWVGLADRADAAPGDLTDAERQRLAIIRAVANRPEILVVDEPAEGLDGIDAERMLKLLGDIHGAGVTVICTSRDVPAAARSSYPIMHLQEGRITVSEPTVLGGPI